MSLVGAAEQTPRLPAWMGGCWIETRGETWIEECWTGPRGGIMLGSGRSGVGDTLLSWKSMQIALDAPRRARPNAPIALFASVRDGARTMYVWRPGVGEGDGIGFENPAGGFPQRIRYWRAGDLLMAESAMLDGSRAIRFEFRRPGSRR
ncbi:DUF6265 family protein [Tsuneonella sp. YG55]|uniref:DUF6265 family protein n=1 Tax=Tsuneonella litorea TaxID=2976475 RepID=A0A9X2VZN2_9SPHN|nr:DUF6265 family protein [Tsuneonella litorea]MCT2558365.1 DUF6265 family protein [Tsuneonella litorea]